MSSTSSSEGDDEPKDARMEVLFCMGDHKHVAWVPSGEKASVYERAKRTFQEFELQKFQLQVFDKSWEEWIDVDESHVVMDREKLMIVIGNHSFHEEPSNEHKRPKLSHLVESLTRNNANQVF
ncbi:uncharacterized protein [Apostichopus japonicus]|uniref:uncharacterized protein n=1 Tax=Stichopus japonicus TaxID=307972 RepID=UPI003AB40CBA